MTLWYWGTVRYRRGSQVYGTRGGVVSVWRATPSADQMVFSFVLTIEALPS